MPIGLCTANYIDDHTRTYLKQFEMTATDLVTLATDWEAVQSAYEGVTQGALRKTQFVWPVDSGAAAPTSGANKDVGATFVGRDSDGIAHVVKVAAFDASLADSYGNIPLDNLAVQTFLALFESAGQCTVAHGKEIAVWISGVLDD